MPAVNPVLPEPPQPASGIDSLLQGLDPEAADALVREYLAETALRQHLQRVHDSHYSSDNPQPRELFRVG